MEFISGGRGMARVHQKRKVGRGTKQYHCSAMPCLFAKEGGTNEIVAGQRYYEWTLFRQSPRRRHVRCGYPLRSQLSNSKMGAVWDAVDGVDLGAAECIEDIKQELDNVASAAHDVAEEYSESAQNISQSFPGSPTAEACEAVASALSEWGDQLESWEPGDRLPKLSEEEFVEQEREAAQSLLDEAPEYEG